jgi:hypothetical protein
VRTGTPLGGADDPRHRYQQLYHAYAEAVREPARLALAAQVAATAPDPMAGLLTHWRIIAAWLGERLIPEPRVALAMSQPAQTAADQDLHWEDLARITLHELAADGAGRAQITALSQQAVTCEVRVAGALEFRQTVQAGQPPVQIDWDAGEPATLTLTVADRRRLELPLVRVQ